MLTERQKHDIRRHMGVPAQGIASTGFTMGYRYFTEAGMLEYRMINLQALEESTLTGNPYGQISIFGVPTVGDVLTVTVNSTPVNYTVTSADVAATFPGLTTSGPLYAVAKNLATAINFANTGIFCAAGPPTSDQAPYQPSGFSTLNFIALNATTFTLAVSQTGNHTGLMVVTNGNVFPTPTVTYDDPESGTATTLYGMLPILNYLEGTRFSATQNLDVSKADVVTLREDEPQARYALYMMARQDLANFMGVPLFPIGRFGGGGMMLAK